MALSRTLRAPRIDLRFVIGLLLVCGSVAGVWWVVQTARVTHPVLVAQQAIVPGQTITARHVAALDVRLAEASDDYVSPEELEEGLVAARAIPAGELVPVSATTAPEAIDLARVVVESALEIPGGVDAGALVELWAAPAVSPGVFDEPQVIVPGAVVAEVLSSDGMMAARGSRVELVVDRDRVAEVLRHASSGSALSVVPVAAEGGAR